MEAFSWREGEGRDQVAGVGLSLPEVVLVWEVVLVAA